MIVYLALGSNVGDSTGNITEATRLLTPKINTIVSAPLYTSRAVGYTDQPDFFNTTIRGETSLEPLELLRFVKDIEQELGRIHRFRWGPREIDIDIIFYDNLVMKSDELTIPHARFAEREFVLRPIADLDPDFVDPVSGLTVGQLLAALPEADQSILTKV